MGRTVNSLDLKQLVILNHGISNELGNVVRHSGHVKLPLLIQRFKHSVWNEWEQSRIVMSLIVHGSRQIAQSGRGTWCPQYHLLSV